MATLALRWGIGLVGIFVVTIMVYKTFADADLSEAKTTSELVENQSCS